MKKYKDLKTDKIYKLGDTLVRVETNSDYPGMPIVSKTSILLTETAVKKLIDIGWIEVIKEKKTKTYTDYYREIVNIPANKIINMNPWMPALAIIKLIKQDFNTPIKDSEGWVFSNITLDFVPININKIKNPNLVTVFAKEDVDNVREIIKPLIDVLSK
jgi:hypothetical protein